MWRYKVADHTKSGFADSHARDPHRCNIRNCKSFRGDRSDYVYRCRIFYTGGSKKPVGTYNGIAISYLCIGNGRDAYRRDQTNSVWNRAHLNPAGIWDESSRGNFTFKAKEEEDMVENQHVFEIKDFSIYYRDFMAVKNVNLNIETNKITAIIGPSGCGKSTLLRALNRMNDLIIYSRVEGKVLFQGVDIYDKETDVIELRRRVGMVFQKPNPFPSSVYENVAYGPRIRGIKKKSQLDEIVENALVRADLWKEVKDKLNESGMSLSGGQMQRLCIARSLAQEPEVLLFDEPTSALDPISTANIENLLQELKKTITIVIVTHNMQQAARISDYTAFMYLGELIEFGLTDNIFVNPQNKLTEEYITGRFG